MATSSQPIALSIAGSDSGAGAGIQADLKTFSSFGVYGTTVVTAVTAQNTVGVRAWERVSPALIRAQLDAVVEDLRPGAIKTGMLGDADIVHAVAGGIRAHRLSPYVLDPVMVATSGDVLLLSSAVAAIVAELFPLATLVTPNLDEAAVLCGVRVDDPASMEVAARILVSDRGAAAALVKGGHLAGNELVDVLFDGRTTRRFTTRRIETRNTHGTGCTLSAAITACVASGDELSRAVERGLEYVRKAIQSAPNLGSGNGPLNHRVDT